MGFKKLREKVEAYLPADKKVLIEEAYRFAVRAHRGQVRLSGEPYIEHPIRTALTLAELQLDASSIAAALLHDVPENCDIPLNTIEERFGAEVGKLVEGVTRLGKLSWSGEDVARKESQAKNLRRMLVAMAEDLRVVFIKLADRLHNMRTLDALPPEKQRLIALETLEIYAPLAHRLGIGELKWQLEDLAFRYLERDRYNEVVALVAARRVQREKLVDQIIQVLQGEFECIGLRAEMSGRPKHIYSIHRKMEKYAALGKQFSDIHDQLALRVLVGTVSECYSALGVIHGLWRPLPGEFNDFIANPKANGYQSLHTTVMYKGITPLEVQLRTRDMHYVAEYGLAAHWRYKEGEPRDVQLEERIGWLRQLIEWHREFSGAEDFLESVKTDIFIDQVFVYTPKGEIKDLPKGATPLDFAYRVHTELGHRCVGAKVNGRLVPFSYQLSNGDVVEIMTAKTAKGPSRDWLSPHLGHVKTSHAREKIRQWFKRQERAENVERGREILEKELKRLGIKAPERREELAKLFGYDSPEDFLFAIGYGGITAHQIAVKLAAQAEAPKTVAGSAPTKRPRTLSIKVLGVGDMLTHLAPCCHPVPGEKIVGYVTRSRGVTVHRADCPNISPETEKERLVPVDWGETDDVYPVSINVEAWDRVGLMHDLTSVVAEEKVNIASISFTNNADHMTLTMLTLETKDLPQLSRLISKIDGVRGVVNVSRVGGDAGAKPAP